LLTQAGEGTDVILGLGYDNSLDDKIGITLIATGFQHKDPFTLPVVKKPEPKEEKIIMVLGQTEEQTKPEEKKMQKDAVAEDKISSPSSAPEFLREELAPKLIDSTPSFEESFSAFMMFEEEDIVRATEEEFLPDEPAIIHWELNMQSSDDRETTALKNEKTTVETDKITVEKLSIAETKEIIISEFQSTTRTNNSEPNPKISTTPVSAASGGYLARPSNIYAESQAEVFTSTPSAEEPVPQNEHKHTSEESLCDMQMFMRDDIPAADEPLAHQAPTPLSTDAEDPALRDEAEEQTRRAAERLHKLRNLSFNVHSADPNNEFENVPAYIRRNMELYGNSFSAVENFYSNYTVKKDENNNTQISTLNTFLDGKKPD
jgi:cell division protein FtsZ